MLVACPACILKALGKTFGEGKLYDIYFDIGWDWSKAGEG
jgi:hypothetical protein